jgi:2-oxoisovalerate dehydrogenase E1 component
MMSARWVDGVEEELVQRGEAFFQLGGAGHEGTAVLADHLGPQDWLQPHYRSRALLIRRGVHPERFFHGLLSTALSDSAGRQMPAFLNDPALNVLPMTVPTGNGLLHAVGVAREIRDQPDAPIVVAGIGDGTTQQGEVMEAIGEAARAGLPVLFLIDDNGYAISTHTAGRTFYDTVQGADDMFLGVPVVRADGRDPITLDAIAGRAIADVRASRRPVILVAQVERLTHHTNADNEAVYRDEVERTTARAGDPITALREHLLAEGVPAATLADMERDVEVEVRAAAARALDAPDPVTAHGAIPPVAPDLLARAAAPAPAADGPPRTMLEAMRDVLAHRLADDPRVSILGQDIEDPKGDVFGLTRGLSTRFPGRVTNAPLSESTIVGTAIGRALAGGRPVAMVQFADFLHLAFNQIAAELATIYWRTAGAFSAPVVVLAPCGAYRPGLGPFHAQTMEATFAHIPGLDVAMPSTAEDAAGVLEAALDGERPTLILYPKTCLNDPARATRAEGPPRPAVPGHAVVRNRGDDVTLVSWGSTAPITERAAVVLDAAGVGVDLIDLRSIAPWDMEAVTASAARTRRLVVVHEDNLSGGFGAEVVARVSDHLEGELRTRRIARPDTWVPNNYINQVDLLPSTRDVLEAVAAMLGGFEIEEARTQQQDGVLVVEATGSSPADQQMMVLEWLVAEGDTVTEGQVIAECEGDKAAFELAAPASGEVRDLHEELESVPVGTPLARITLAPGALAARRRVPAEPTLRLRRVPGASPSPIRAAAPSPEAQSLPVGLSGIAVRAGRTILTNADIAARFPGRSEEDIVRRTGIRQRPILADDQDLIALTAQAAREALDTEGMTLGDLEAIIVATGTPPRLSPTVACLVQNALAEQDGHADVAAHDVSAACSGYLYALQGAHDMLQQRRDASVLVITAEAMSQFVDPDDFDTVVVFGDAVTATVVHGPTRVGDSPLLLHRPLLSATGDDGSIIRHGPRHEDHLFMDGPRVYSRAVREMLRMLDRAAAESGVSMADLMHVIPHQANGRIISSVQARSGLPEDRFVVNVANWGNTSSSTIPIAISEHLATSPRGLGGLVAFGAGLTSAAAIVEFTETT